MKTLTDVKRFNMIEQQIRTWDVFDASILDLYDKIKREAYVPETYKKIAFTDVQIPLQHKQYMLAPKQEARVLQSLKLKPTDHILHIRSSGHLSSLWNSKKGSVIEPDSFQRRLWR